MNQNKFEYKIRLYQELLNTMIENQIEGECRLTQRELAEKLKEKQIIASQALISQMLKKMIDNKNIIKTKGYIIKCQDIFEIDYFKKLREIITATRKKPELKQLPEKYLCELFDTDIITIKAAKGYLSNEL